MRFLILASVLLLILMPVNAEPKAKKKEKSAIERFFASLSPSSAKKTPLRKSTTKSRHRRVPTSKAKPIVEVNERAKNGIFIVDATWMATYWEQELAWDYPIPEDADIKFRDGKYHVPSVVYRHYEDMLNTVP